MTGGIEIKDRVKIIHSSELKTWTHFPEYRDYAGPTIGEYQVRRQAVEEELRNLGSLAQALKRLADLDVQNLVEYVRHEIDVPRSVWPCMMEIVLPEPIYDKSIIRCDCGEVSGQVLRIRRSWRKQTVTANYACPSWVINAKEIAILKETVSTLGEEDHARLTEAQSSRYLQPVLFISHRWDGVHHPDPEGKQLAKLQMLENCFLIYDYTSIPQATDNPEDNVGRQKILSGMNTLIWNVLVLGAPDFLERGWCIYEYTLASMRASLVCDELNDTNFVLLRNLAATVPPISSRISGSGMESQIQNAKNQRTLETVNTIMPLFNRSKFTVEQDREMVRKLLVSELMQTLPGKMEYTEYIGEWKTRSWTEEELREAFASELKWDRMQHIYNFKPFRQKVPSTVTDAVTAGYQLDLMPAQNDMTWSTLIDSNQSRAMDGLAKGLVVGLLGGLLITGIGIVLILVCIFLMVRWIFF